MSIDLYTYFRSSAAYRVRIALEYKGLAANHHAVSLLAGEQHAAAYAKLNPQHQVPTLVDGDAVITQSLAIIEYLDEAYPATPPLIWGDAATRARIRSLGLVVACDIHPISNLRVLNFLRAELGQDDKGIRRWCAHWISLGFTGFEAMLAQGGAGRHCVGDAVSLADVALVPQVFNAKRFGVDLTPYPQLLARYEAARALAPFIRAEPGRQPDA
ncbi:MAG: hypothetical protein RIR70_1035 [Pseudomonadota bacterium]|jgi:maleylacetoacetate isomerase/maleylpyruvate isomerase